MSTALSKKNKKKCTSESSDDELLEKALNIMNEPNDECAIFGSLIASEMRQISNSDVRKCFKNDILKVLLNYNDVDNVLVCTSTMSEQNM